MTTGGRSGGRRPSEPRRCPPPRCSSRLHPGRGSQPCHAPQRRQCLGRPVFLAPEVPPSGRPSLQRAGRADFPRAHPQTCSRRIPGWSSPPTARGRCSRTPHWPGFTGRKKKATGQGSISSPTGRRCRGFTPDSSRSTSAGGSSGSAGISGRWHNSYRLTDHIGQAVFDRTTRLRSLRSHPGRPAGAGAVFRPGSGAGTAATTPGVTSSQQRSRDTTTTAGNQPSKLMCVEAGKAKPRILLLGPPGFRPRRRMVSWFDPRMLAMTGFNAVSSEFFRTFLDKREVEILLPRRDMTSNPPGRQPGPCGLRSRPGRRLRPDVRNRLAPRQGDAGSPPGPEPGRPGTRAGPLPDHGRRPGLPCTDRERYPNQMVGPYSVALRGRRPTTHRSYW